MIIRKLFEAEVAHRVLGAYSKRCQGVHGHSYKIEIFLEDEKLDETGMVMDFKLLKEQVKPFIDAFDHSLLISLDDKDLIDANINFNLNSRYILVPYNPTAEQMAKHIFQFLYEELKINVVKVIVHETNTGYAICDKNYGDIDLGQVYMSEGITDGDI